MSEAAPPQPLAKPSRWPSLGYMYAYVVAVRRTAEWRRLQ